MNWEIATKLKSTNVKERRQELIEFLLEQRALTSETQIRSFFSPLPPDLGLIGSLKDLDQKQLHLAVKHIRRAIKNKQPILVYGDYDCDGICATALLWETLHSLGALARPFIPRRDVHGYGLSAKGIKEAVKTFDKTPLIITVDNGITASKTISAFPEYEFIVTDHHQPSGELPETLATVHSQLLSGTGVAWVLASSLLGTPAETELVALGTVCDLLPLLGANRSLVISGLKQLRATRRPGLQALYTFAGIKDESQIDTYHLGYLIGPRINAVGRLGHGLDALRLLCTRKAAAASALAQKLSTVNQDRQLLTSEFTSEAERILTELETLPKILVVASPNFHEGIIGLVASKLVEKYHRPAVAVSLGETVSKGSARSVSGIDITKLLLIASQGKAEMGGHSQAAGFKLETEFWPELEHSIGRQAELVDEKLLAKRLSLVTELMPSDLSLELYQELEQFAPFGMGNDKPLFASVLSIRQGRPVGQNDKHLKLELEESDIRFQAIGFGLGSRWQKLGKGLNLRWAYSLEKNTWQGISSLQLQIKDLTAEGV
jgi:single-stranded-DNA-specific exonuclease